MIPSLTTGQLVATNYIKYERLHDIVRQSFAGSTANEVNIFIDLYSCFKPLYSPLFNVSNKMDDYEELAAIIINMIAHYREFFRRNPYNVHTKFFLVFSNNIPYINTLNIPDYNNSMQESIKNQPDVTETIKQNLSLVDKIIPYINDASLTIGNYETSVIMYDIMKQVAKPNVPNIVITKDNYNYQLAALVPDTIIFRPKKNKGEDESYFIERGGVIDAFLYEEGKTDIDNTGIKISPELLSVIMAMSKLKSRGFKSVINIPRTLKILNELIQAELISNSYNSSMEYILENIREADKQALYKHRINNRYNAINIIAQYDSYINSAERLNFKGLMNLYDPKSIHRIATEYFKTSPLQLERL